MPEITNTRRVNLALGALMLLTATSCGSPRCEGVTWAGWVNVSASGSTITKNTGSDAWNAGAVSSQTVSSGNIAVEVTVDKNTDFKMFGLNHNDSTADYVDIDYAIDLQADKTISVWENGVHVAAAGGDAYVAGDIFKVAAEKGLVNYYKNGKVFYTSQVPPAYPLFVDASIWTDGAQLTATTCIP